MLVGKCLMENGVTWTAENDRVRMIIRGHFYRLEVLLFSFRVLRMN